jgi:MFS family permease
MWHWRCWALRRAGVVWYTGQFYALFFLTLILKVDPLSAYEMIGLSLLLGTPFFIVFGWLSDRIGRLKIILAGTGCWRFAAWC